MVYNGYTDVKVEKWGEVPGNFTLTFVVVPYTYETVWSGLFSSFSAKEKKGLLIAIGKSGKVQVRLGTGNETFVMESRKSYLQYQKPNLLTVAYWGDAGWCDLSINGVLSHRIQLPRHSKIVAPYAYYYLGKYIDEGEFTKETQRGYFHGELHLEEFEPNYTQYDAVERTHQNKKTAIAPIRLYNETEVQKDPYRPALHLMPPGKWMNEPHAPFYYRGYYHLFYQANPHAPIWDNLCWGHLVSKDLVTWEYVGIALNPDTESDNEIDPDGCWSGSACLDGNGNPMLFYTAGNNRKIPNQSVAMALPCDLQDERLQKWEKKGVILEQAPDQGFLGEFRDPFVFCRNGRYFILVGSGDRDNGGGNALVYTTRDFKDFAAKGFLMEYDYESNPEVGHVWELPVLLPLKDQTGKKACDIVLLCACQIEGKRVETYYFLGEFQEDSGTFLPYHSEPRLIDLGHGTFTGPSGFVTPDDRSIVFTIEQGRRGPAEYEAGWAHTGGMPVELSYADGELKVDPVQEIRGYFTEKTDPEELLLENLVEVTTQGSKLEIQLEAGKGGYVVAYDRSTKRFTATDRINGQVVSLCRGEVDEVEIGTDPIYMEAIIDHCSIEIYLNHKKSMTLRNYTYQEGYRLQVKAEAEYQATVKKMAKQM
ncbi:MAG: glycoside hydrolase family 32 protein [Lachnospiraceae bacterium]|nr:glycoside hydrolase family 32 protein [Lachnospiraceae bacterium]